MWVEVEGARKKVACGPCIRGHRSSKCDHKDRVLQEVRKPGRPLSSCPHPVGTCNCGPVSISYTIPKTSSCLCPSDDTAAANPTPTTTLSSNANRVQKTRSRKSTSLISPASLEKALNTPGQRLIAPFEKVEPPSNAPVQDSEPNSSTGGSPTSSTSSTPHTGPISPRHQSQSDTRAVLNEYRIVAAKPPSTSSCCRPKAKVEASPESQGGSCCSSKSQAPKKEVAEKKSCCSGPKVEAGVKQSPQPGHRKDSQHNTPIYHQFPANSQFQSGVPLQMPTFNSVAPGTVPNMVMPGHTQAQFVMSPSYGFIAPMYGNSGVHQPPAQIPIQYSHHTTNSANQSDVEHNCHCGDSCACFGCAAHPQNPTTTAYLLDMDNFMRNGGSGPSQVLPAYPHQPSQMTQQPYGFAYHPSAQGISMHGVPQSMPFQFSANKIPNMYQQNNTTQDWPQNGLQMTLQSTPTSKMKHFNINGQRDDHSQIPRPGTAKQEDALNSPAYEDSPGDQDSEPTLSPSSFFLQTLVLPGCNDVTGTCQCGDGCECVGCLTHGGHDGVPLEPPTNLPPTDFDDFLASGTDQHHFFTPPYSEAPA